MAHHRQRRISISLAILIAGVAASPGVARPRQRISHIVMRPPASIADRSGGSRMQAPVWLTSVDRFSLTAGREHRVTAELGSGTVSIVSGRLHSGKTGLPDRDTWSVTGAEVEFTNPLAGALTLSVDGKLASMRRRFHAVPAGATPQSTHIVEAGLALSNEDGMRIAIDYLDISAPAAGGPMSRMAALLGGAPRAGTGARLSISAPIGAPRGMRWTLAASRMDRPSSDMRPLGISGTTDTALMLSINRRF